MDQRINHYNCIYMYINKTNGKKYVGKAKDFNRRRREHISDSYNEKRHDYNIPFHNAIRKYGIDNFEIKILAENIPTQEKMNEYEIFFIERYKTFKTNGYNLTKGGDGGNTYIGKTDEEINETKRKQSEARKGDKNGMYGKHHTEEAKRKISENHANNKGENHPMYGKHLSEEVKQKMKENHADFKGNKHPQAKKVIQFDLNMNMIKIWGCSKDITDKFKWNNRTLRSHLDGKCKSHEYNGFIWYYKEEYEELNGSTGRN